MPSAKWDFAEDLMKWKALHADLISGQRVRAVFEDRFHVFSLRFPLEQVMQEDFQPQMQSEYTYCLFVDQKGWRHLPLQPQEVGLAQKIKYQIELSQEEKASALLLLRKLAL